MDPLRGLAAATFFAAAFMRPALLAFAQTLPDRPVTKTGSGSAEHAPACGTVEVAYPSGRPVVGAEVTHYYTDPNSNRDLTGRKPWLTNREGRVCRPTLLDRGFLDVYAPLALGGWCAAFERLRYAGWRPGVASVTKITLHVRRFGRARWRGRVVASDGTAVPGAAILVEPIFPGDTDCSERGPDTWFSTADDGTFRLPLLPRGRATLRVERDGYAAQLFSIALPGPARDLVIDRGAQWNARVLDPEGIPIESCSLVLRMRDGVAVRGHCSASGFELRAVPAGDAVITVRVDGPHATLGRSRALISEVHIAPNEQRRDDIVWPAGASVCGTVVTDAGEIVANAEVIAFSSDTDRSSAEGAMEATADAAGQFCFRHLSPGGWVVVADRRSVEQAQLAVQAGESGVRLVVPAPRFK